MEGGRSRQRHVEDVETAGPVKLSGEIRYEFDEIKKYDIKL